MLKYVSAALLLALSAAGCSKKPADAADTSTLAATSFENLDGWLADSPALATLTRDKAHTGRYSTMVGPSHEFSLGYSNALSRLAPEWPARLTVGAWVLLPPEHGAAKLVTQIKGATPGTPDLLWEGLDLTQAVKIAGKWQYVEQTITMPEAAKPTSKILVYLWRADSKQPVYLDDLSISLTKDQ
ncbi:hypothetical protein HNQ93_002984 [Hymenobacter luteus]|uniref:CBM-cenC domain-containing protein n=2 Tax=Hymenobacter TaxID=89966 RepID=A0A7W9T2Y8_9BACT|nr:hypothetical protein [Hymenobacter latericoloratus]MBB4603220.1 hypothetical protein [Hymenobacter latericoloratus]MBB6060118.1 hypothetical protein [Hymenobacter luteus]